MTTSGHARGVAEHFAGAPAPLNGAGHREAAHRFAFLLVPGFSHVAFASAIEPLRMVNMVSGHLLCSALSCSLDGDTVAASNGVRIQPDFAVDDLPTPDTVFVCGPNPIAFPEEGRLAAWLRRLARHGVAVGGIDTGSYLLARAGLLRGYRCTIHWQDMPALLAEFPDLVLSEHVFEIDRSRYTASGGTAAMDMMLELVARTTGERETTAAAADLLVHERVRDRRDRQRVPLRHRPGADRTALSGALTLMEANIEEPIPVGELAAYVEVSERHLERLFEQHMGATPSQVYMQLRLARARRLLLGTPAAIGEVARQCGFASIGHFSKRYRREFGATPHQDRTRASGATEAD